jgi:CysZ protein
LLKDYIIATGAYGKSHKLIKRRNLWSQLLIPGLIYMFIFLAGFYVFFTTLGNVVNERVLEDTGIRKWLDDMDSGFLRFIFSFTSLVVWMVGALFYFSLFKYIWLIICSPVLALLSAKAHQWTEGENKNASKEDILHATFRGVQVALRNFVWQSVYFLAFFVVALFPVVGWVVPFFALLMEAYYMGFSMLDYVMGQNKVGMTETRRYVAERKGLAVGNGAGFYVMLIIPVLGWVMAPAYAMASAAFTVKESDID